MIFIIKVTTGQEKIISGILAKKAKKENLEIYSIINLDKIRGYLFVETLDENNVVKLIQRVRNVKGILKKPIELSEIENMMQKVEEKISSISVGDIVEMISGPFKGEKAKIVRVDENKDEVTGELVEVAVPIPITVKSKVVKLFQKKKE